MHVDWRWIKQRPHFLAEEMTKCFDVLVLYPYAYRRAQLVKNKTRVRRLPMFQLPFSRLKTISRLNEFIRDVYAGLCVSFFQPQIVFLTFPAIVSHRVIGLNEEATIVYDCMDDAPAFAATALEKARVRQREETLLKAANVILVSSDNLKSKVIQRGAWAEKTHTVRNAYSGELYSSSNAARAAPRSLTVPLRILYFGTIGEYVDFEVLLQALEAVPGVSFHFIGPVQVQTPVHERLTFLGPVDHSSLSVQAPVYDAFILPFKRSELIDAVDPVKMYEYINFHKSIISSYWPELNRFRRFVTFYRDRHELVAALLGLLVNNKPKYSNADRESFLKGNDWKARGATIYKLIQTASRC
jgi:teichuronic acid biosynthesis glycosyltransferase TuaH